VARRSLLSLILSLMLLFPAVGGGMASGDGQACPLSGPAAASRVCPCQPSPSVAQDQPDSACHCPPDAPCQVSNAPLTQAPDMVVASLDWPQAPGLTALGLPSLLSGPVLHLASRPVPPAPPPEPLYLQKASLLI
jgi:hypothetical protein